MDPLSEQRDPLGTGGSVTHRDIFVTLGIITGKIEFLVQLMEEKRANIATLDARMNSVEQKAAAGTAFAILASILLPLLVNHFSAQSRLPALNAEEIRMLKIEMDRLNASKEQDQSQK